jgi:tetratricopeptide (TPR) repeat protein
MKTLILTGILALAAGFSSMAQQGQPAPTGPAPKSQEEATALQALFNPQNDADATIKSAEDLLAKFADTQFKEAALTMEAEAYQRKGDTVKAQVYAEQVLAVNPKSLDASILLGEVIVQNTRENDLTKQEKLATAEKHMKNAQETLSTMAKPNPQMTDPQWAEYKQFTMARIHNDFGLVAVNRKDWQKAIDEFKVAAEGDPQQQAFEARLASAYQSAGKNAESIQVCDRMLAKPDLNAAIKRFVTNVRAMATKASQPAGSAAPAAPAAPAVSPAPPAK